MGITLDFTGVESGFDPLATGFYDGTIVSLEKKTGKQSGKDYLEVTIKLRPDPDRGVGDKRQLFTNYSLQSQALWRLKQLLLRLGQSADSLKGNFNLDADMLLGKNVVVQVGPPDPGYNSNKVVDVFEEGHEPAVSASQGASPF